MYRAHSVTYLGQEVLEKSVSTCGFALFWFCYVTLPKSVTWLFTQVIVLHSIVDICLLLYSIH